MRSLFLVCAFIGLIHGQSISPSTTPVKQTKPFVKPQVEQSIFPVTQGQENNHKQQLQGPVQPSSDFQPPGEIQRNSDFEDFSNVRTIPGGKLKRDNEVAGQQISSRILLPGSWGWTGGSSGGISGGNGGNYEKPGSCYRGNYGNGNNYGGNGGYNNNYYPRNYRVRRQAYTPYYNGNSVGTGYTGGNYYQGGNTGYYPSGPIHGGNGGGNGISYCYRDYDCSGNLKCCDGYCRTPAYIG